MIGDDVIGKPILGELPPEWTAPDPEPEVPPTLTDEDKSQLRQLIALYRKALDDQTELLGKMDLPRIHGALAAGGGRMVYAMFLGVNHPAAVAAEQPLQDDDQGAYGSVILAPGVEEPGQIPQLLLQSQATPLFIRFLQAGVFSLVRMHGLASLGALLDVFDVVGEQMIQVKRALTERGRRVSELVEKAFAEQELEEWKKQTGGALS